jgi:hypothetical protein
MKASQPASVKSRFGGAFALTLAFASFLCFSLPVLLYTGNRAEFAAPLKELLLPVLTPAVVAVIILASLLALLPQRLHARLMVLLAALCLLCWLQGTLLVWEYGLFDGGRIDWTVARWRGWVDACLWIAVILATDAWRGPLQRVLPRLAILACAMQAALALVSLATQPERPALPPSDAAAATLAHFSRQANVLHILADGMQTGVVADLMDEQDGRLARDFDGFTFFEDNLGAFPYTHMSVPAMMGGLVYDNSEAQGEFLDRALGHASIFGVAKANGYEVEVGVPGGGISEVYQHVADAKLVPLPDAPTHSGWRGAKQERLLLADLALFRLVPHFAKQYVYNDQDWLLQNLFGSSSSPGISFLAHEGVLRELAARAQVDSPRPTYKLLHLMLSHRPMVMNADCSYAARVLDPKRNAVRDQARCAFGSISGLLARLRALGIYDNTTIVISGDHGTFLAPRFMVANKSEAALAYRRGLPPTMIGHARPLLLVKPAHARGALRISQAPTWVADTPATIADAAGMRASLPGLSALRLEEGAGRERRYYSYDYLRSDWTARYLAPLREYIVRGRGNRVGSWSRGRTLEPPAASR